MADAKVDKSLDDIIKERKISARNGARGAGGLRRGGRGAGRGGAGARTNGRGGPKRFGTRSNTAGGIMKRRSGGGPVSPAKAAAVNRGLPDGQWDHDLYQNGGGRRRSGGVVANGTGLGPAKLVIANLDFGVNDQDIQGLFQEFGNIRKAAVHYDRSGRSLGTADVLFERKADAIRALKKYNGVSLDGRPMNIQMAGSAPAVGVQPSRISGGGAQVRNGGRTAGNATRGRGGGARRGGRGGGAAGAGQKKTAKSAADLDADLDAYNSKMQTD